MASNNKRKTTMAKLNRERGLVERRLAKQARKAARKLEAAHEQHPERSSTSEEVSEAPEQESE